MAFNARTSTHDRGNALAMARLSELAYVDPGEQRARAAAILDTPILEFESLDYAQTETGLFMLATADAIIVSFRGTTSEQNWLSNGQILLIPFRNTGRVHAGFQQALNQAMPDIQARLSAWSGQGRTLWFTGHSLGGALALLAVANLRFPLDPTATAPRPVSGLYTFGQPRAGSQEFCATCDAGFGKFYFRYVNDQDIVTRVPPRVSLYWHAGQVRYIDAQGRIQDDPSWWHQFLDLVSAGKQTLQDLQSGTLQVAAIEDHRIANYIRLIENAP